MKKTLIPIALAFALITVAPAAFAAASATLTVQASVAANCTITAATLNFGPYDPVVTNALAGVDLDASTTMNVACTKGFIPIITIPLLGRTMTGGLDTLTYLLFSDSARLVTFGETLLTGSTMTAALNKLARPVTIYGRIPKDQDVGVSAYSGTIQVTVNF